MKLLKVIIRFLLGLDKKKMHSTRPTEVELKEATKEVEVELECNNEQSIEVDDDDNMEPDEIETPKKIIIKKHYLPKKEYMEGPTKKEWFFLHHTAGWENPFNVIDSWARDNRGPAATEFLIGGQRITNNDSTHDGVIVQCMPEGAYGWHLGVGRRKVHTHSVGVELNNFGYLTKGGYHTTVEGKKTWIRKTPGKFYTYVGTLANSEQVIELEQEFRGYKYWHNYSDAQIESLKQLILFIQERDNINPVKGLVELIKEKGAFKAFDFMNLKHVTDTPGLWCHTNVQRGKFDLYPHPKLVEMLLNL
jgi:hypothetical protein